MVAVSHKKKDEETAVASSSCSAGGSSNSDGDDDDISASVPVMADCGSSEESDGSLGPIPDLERLTSTENQSEQSEEQARRDLDRKIKNRDAARRCRKRRGDQMQELAKEKKVQEDLYENLKKRIAKETESIRRMKHILTSCGCHRKNHLPSLSLKPFPTASTTASRLSTYNASRLSSYNGRLFQCL